MSRRIGSAVFVKTELLVTFQCLRNEIKLNHSCYVFVIFQWTERNFQAKIGYRFSFASNDFKTLQGSHFSELYGSPLHDVAE